MRKRIKGGKKLTESGQRGEGQSIKNKKDELEKTKGVTAGKDQLWERIARIQQA